MCFLNIDELVHLIAVKMVGKKEKKEFQVKVLISLLFIFV